MLNDVPNDKKRFVMFATRPGRILADVLACLIIAVTLAMAVKTTNDLTWPPRWDFYRDLGTMQAVLDGRSQDDPIFLGEHSWYNPLIPSLLALASKWSSLPLPAFVVRVGPFINLLVPIGFYLFCRRLLKPWPALAALTIFLFWVPPHLPPNSSGLYSPWAWPRNVAQGLYFCGALTLYEACRRRSMAWDIASGVLIGLVFLAHTAPALMLASAAAILTALAAARATSWDEAARYVGRLAIVGLVALLTAAPYLVPIFLRYRFQVLNPEPMMSAGPSMLAMGLSLLSVRSALALLGAGTLVRRYRQGPSLPSIESVVLMALAGACIAWFALSGTQHLLFRLGIKTVQVVPEFHFHMYLKTFEAAMAGLGLVTAVDWCLGKLRGAFGALVRADGQRWRLAAYTAACALVMLGNARGYLNSPDLKLFREESLARDRKVHLTHFYVWALEHTTPDSVFLADNWYALFVVSPTARKVVSTYPFYANPYVALEPRDRLRADLYEALNSRAFDRFLERAHEARVTFVIAASDAEGCCRVLSPLPDEAFRVVFDDGPLRVYEVRAGADGLSPRREARPRTGP